MKSYSDTPDLIAALQLKLAGLEESSVHRTYNPESQQRLEELERFKTFIDHSNDCMFLIEVPTGRIVDVNGCASSRMGWSRNEFLEASLFDLSGLGNCPEAAELVRSPLGQELMRALTVTELYQKEGGCFHAEVTLNRMSLHDRVYVLAVVRDITERKLAEEALRQSLHAHNMEAFSRLAGGMEHDFNNILMAIMWYASMLKTDAGLVPQQMEKVEHILLASEKGAHLTSSLHAFSLAAGLEGEEEVLADAAAPEGGAETIMVAEDESALRTLIGNILTSYGYRVIVARDGQEAVEKFEAEGGNVALILMDMIMPRMNGKEACDAIRTLDPKAKVIFTSGYTMDILQSRDLLHEATELIMKPVHPVDLLRKVREMLDK